MRLLDVGANYYFVSVCVCVHCVHSQAARQAYGHVCIFTWLCLMGLGDVVLNVNTSTHCSPVLITALACRRSDQEEKKKRK